jgi:hypothetical protein
MPALVYAIRHWPTNLLLLRSSSLEFGQRARPDLRSRRPQPRSIEARVQGLRLVSHSCDTKRTCALIPDVVVTQLQLHEAREAVRGNAGVSTLVHNRATSEPWWWGLEVQRKGMAPPSTIVSTQVRAQPQG